MKKNFKETSKTGGTAWFLQRVSAIILFTLLMLHFITYHFVGSGDVTYARVVEAMKSPWFNLIQFLFLITAIYHGFNGLWAVIEDYVHHKAWRMVLFGAVMTLALSLFFIGLLTLFKVANLA